MESYVQLFEDYSWSDSAVKRLMSARTAADVLSVVDEYWARSLGEGAGLAAQMAYAASDGYEEAVEEGDDGAFDEYWSEDALWYGFVFWAKAALEEVAYAKDSGGLSDGEIFDVRGHVMRVKAEKAMRKSSMGSAELRGIGEIVALVGGAQSQDFEYGMRREFSGRYMGAAVGFARSNGIYPGN